MEGWFSLSRNSYMAKMTDALKDRLSRYRQIKISVIGRELTHDILRAEVRR
jgi:hypothetical protein